MNSKEQNKEAAKSLMSDNQKMRNEKNYRKLSLVYKPLLGEDYLRKYSSQPGRVRHAVKQAQNDRSVVVVFLGFLICMGVLIYGVSSGLNIVVFVACCIGFGLYIRQLISKKAKALLDEV